MYHPTPGPYLFLTVPETVLLKSDSTFGFTALDVCQNREKINLLRCK